MSLAIAGIASGCVRCKCPLPSPPAATPSTAQAAEPSADARTLELGKALFVAKCGRCHNADGSKALASGPPLSQRALSEEAIAKNVAPRLRGATEEEKRAVAAYIRSFLQTTIH